MDNNNIGLNNSIGNIINIKKTNGSINKNNTITIENTKFYKNKANNFGGAIFYEFTDQYYHIMTSNNEILYNNAGIMGGGIYSNNRTDTTFFNSNNNNIDKNTVNSSKNDYTSKISYIALDTKLKDNSIEVHTGEVFQLQFSLHDDYDNIITDITKYYSALILKITIEEIQKFDYYNRLTNNIHRLKKIYDNVEYSISGNTCSFINGK